MSAIDDLSDPAKIAYRAFLDMNASKDEHFGRLEALDAIYESGGVPSPAEKLELERLLAVHDKNVLAFRTAMAAVTDEDEKLALIRLMS